VLLVNVLSEEKFCRLASQHAPHAPALSIKLPGIVGSNVQHGFPYTTVDRVPSNRETVLYLRMQARGWVGGGQEQALSKKSTRPESERVWKLGMAIGGA
jgi:hypothetical protein